MCSNYRGPMALLLVALCLLCGACAAGPEGGSPATPATPATPGAGETPTVSATPGEVEVLAEGEGKGLDGAGAFEATFSVWTDKYDGTSLGGPQRPSVTAVVPLENPPIPGLVKLVEGLKEGGKRRATITASEIFGTEVLPRMRLKPEQVLFTQVTLDKVFPKEKLETKTVKAGTGDKTVEQGSKVRMHYTGWLEGYESEKKFDSSRDRNTPIALEVGAGQVIPGWDQGLMGMKKGEVRRLKIPHYLGYGNRQKQDIPPYSTLYFETELVEFIEPGELVSKTVKEGKGEPAKAGDQVRVHYTGWLDGFDGKMEFDSSREEGRSPFEFTLGKGQVIQGWDKGVEGMKPGEVRRLTIPYNLAYGEQGRPPSIPPFSTLYFDVEYLGPATPAETPAATPAP